MRIHTISAKGYGPHTDTTLNIPEGRARFSACSEAGKTTVTSAILALCLWGVDVGGRAPDTGAVRDEVEAAEVALHLHAPALMAPSALHPACAVSARLSRSGAASWGVMGKKCASKAALAKELGPVGANMELGMSIVIPQFWRSLAMKERGRPLRDLLLQILPPGDLAGLVRSWMGEQWADDLPLHLDDQGRGAARITGALALQKARNKAQQQAEGAADMAAGLLAKARAALDEAARPPILPEAPDQAKVESAGRYITAAARYEEWQRADAAWQAQAAAHAAATAAVAGWEARRDALGARPLPPGEPLPESEIKAMRAKVSKLRADIAAFGKKAREQPDSMGQLRSRAAQLKVMVESPALCPHCDKPLHRSYESQDQVIAALADAEDQVRACQASWDARWRVAVAEAEREIGALEVTIAAQDAIAKDKAAWVAWDRASQALGQCPPAPQALPRSPDPYAGPTMDPGKLARAKALISQSETWREAQTVQQAAHQVALRGAESGLADAQARATEAAERLALATAQAAQASALVDALRRAPSEIAREGQAKIAKPLAQGGISLVWAGVEGASTDFEIEVLIDGRPWHLASSGRQVRADAWFRAILRTLATRAIPVPPDAPLGWGDLPVVVDSEQSWSGAWFPGGAAPLWFLRTTRAERIEVAAW